MNTQPNAALVRLKREWRESLLCGGLDISWAAVPKWLKEQYGLDPALAAATSEDLTLNLPRLMLKQQECYEHYIKEAAGATAGLVCAFKFNRAFYPGAMGDAVLRSVIPFISKIYGDKLILSDGKRGDIDNTQAEWAHECLDDLGFDGSTLNPYMGYEAVAPFASRADKLSFVLALTSNKGSRDFQYTRDARYKLPLYLRVVRKTAAWNRGKQSLGLVVGATHVRELQQIRREVPTMPILIPGVGAQQGDLERSVRNGITKRGDGILINVSRGLFKGADGPDFAVVIHDNALQYRNAINDFRG